ncbi:hypothetical protein QUW63_05055 [Pseudoflavonifractor phocaeensis]|uniref:hypothetical protein n=1 Tax=Pseudoflavonifractor phocaeensis TaxID=1870988 RepID=UPI0025A45C29|nr:hypothetical protein [Pseudoflavonifractor phocaeensis]MDM8238469.1 hypothetical protein [Pseudoflavonifractor phocaeensis]
MTNDLDHLLEQVEDALEDGEEQLWQPDLTDLILPSPPVQAAGEASEDAIRTAQHTSGQDALQQQLNQELLDRLPAGQSHGDNHLEQLLDQFSAGQGLSDVQQRQRWARSQLVQGGQAGTAQVQSPDRPRHTQGSLWAGEETTQARPNTPALLEQLREFDRTQASLDALSRSQGGGSLTSRTSGRLPETGTQYDPASLGDSPLAAAAAAAREEDQARAVDRVFQRDSRRYDRGFSLY